MKHRIHHLIAALTACILAANTAAHAQPAPPPPPRDGGGGSGGGHGPSNAALTAEQLARVKSLLARYKAASLTVDDAKAIKRAFRDAEIRPGPALEKAMKDAGFSAQRLEALDPRPSHPPHPPGPPRADAAPKKPQHG